MNGLNIIANNEITIKGTNMLKKLVNAICIPNETKNNVAKKSLNGLTCPCISKLYGNEARPKPAINAPITIEKPIEYANNEKKKNAAMEVKNNNS